MGNKQSTLVIFGATGAIGNEIVKIAINSNTISQIHSIQRSDLVIDNSKLINHKLDELDSLKIDADVAIITLGTTLKKAGSKEAFIKVDKDLVVTVATWAKNNNIKELHVVSAIGANSSQNQYYNRTKGEMENALISIDITSLNIYRPSLLHGAVRKEFRLSESVGYYALKLMCWIPGLKKYGPVHITEVAKTIMKDINGRPKGVNIFESDGDEFLKIN